MNTHLKKILHYFHEIFRQVTLWYKEQSKVKQVGIGALILIALFFIVKTILGTSVVEDDLVSTLPQVTVASVASLSNLEGDFPLIGTVTSVSEATLRSEGSGKLVRVYKKLGDIVYAGGVIAEFENSAERASLLQAEGVYEQAKASRDITSLNSGQATNSLIDTKSQALNTIVNTYTTLDDAVHGKTDSAFREPQFAQAKFLLSVPDANLVNTLESKRKAIETMLVAREMRNNTITTSSDLIVELATTQSEVQIIKQYLDDLFTAYTKALPDSSFSQASIDAGKANVQSARQSVAGALSAVIASRASIVASITANQIAGNQTSEKSGAQASSDAQVKQALGAYNGALSRLEKTVIRSPITGTLNSLSIRTGDYIGAFTQVAVVSNNGALEVLSFVTEDDAKRIIVGAPVMINNSVAGTITRIASAIDQTTKKIEVRIGIRDAKSSLINGQSVRITITKDKKVTTTKKPVGPLVIPISALKLTPRGASVFTVTASGTLSALPVKEGAILGEQIQILEGLVGSEVIVTDARGLKEGNKVEVITK